MSSCSKRAFTQAAVVAFALSAVLALQSCATAQPAPAAATGASAVPASGAVAPTKTYTSTTMASDQTVRLARSVGYFPEVRNGVTVYCKTDANIGTLFKTKKCVDEDALRILVQQRENQQDTLRSLQCSGSCGGK